MAKSTFRCRALIQKTRYENVAIHRIVTALNQQSSLLPSFLDEFNYSPGILGSLPRVELERSRRYSRSFLGSRYDRDEYFERPRVETRASIFPDLAQSSYKGVLLQHLALPDLDDGYMTYSIYWSLAPLLQKSNQIREAIKEFDNLNDQSKQAFIHYISEMYPLPNAADVTNSNYRTLAEIASRLGDAASKFPDIADTPTSALDLCHLHHGAAECGTCRRLGRKRKKIVEPDAGLDSLAGGGGQCHVEREPRQPTAEREPATPNA